MQEIFVSMFFIGGFLIIICEFEKVENTNETREGKKVLIILNGLSIVAVIFFIIGSIGLWTLLNAL
jgi:hypothetical protein